MRHLLRLSRRRVAFLTTAILVAAAGPALSAVPADAAGPTIVTIQFDDGVADQFFALGALQARGMRATFYINSGLVGDADHMSWAQLHELAAAGNEIAGHTTTHANLKRLKTGPARQEVCGDRVALMAQGFHVTSFAYPFGSFSSGSKEVVRACGYNSGRGVSGVNGRRVFAETIPPLDAYATRTPPNIKSSTTVATMQSYVTGAEQNGGGHVQLVFHHICDHCDAYSVTPADFVALLDWLKARELSGTVVRTTHEVIGGPVQPPIPAS